MVSVGQLVKSQTLVLDIIGSQPADDQIRHEMTNPFASTRITTFSFFMRQISIFSFDSEPEKYKNAPISIVSVYTQGKT